MKASSKVRPDPKIPPGLSALIQRHIQEHSCDDESVYGTLVDLWMKLKPGDKPPNRAAIVRAVGSASAANVIRRLRRLAKFGRVRQMGTGTKIIYVPTELIKE